MSWDAYLSAAIMVFVGLFGAFGWANIVMTARTRCAQGRRARLIGVQLSAISFVTSALWLVHTTSPSLIFFLYLHATIVTALDLCLIRWRRWRLWAGVRLEEVAAA